MINYIFNLVLPIMKWIFSVYYIICKPTKDCLTLSFCEEMGKLDSISFCYYFINKLIFLSPTSNNVKVYSMIFTLQETDDQPSMYIENVHNIINENFRLLNIDSYNKFFNPKFNAPIKKYLRENIKNQIGNEEAIINRINLKFPLKDAEYSEFMVSVFILHYIDIIIDKNFLTNDIILLFVTLISDFVEGFYFQINCPDSVVYLTKNEFRGKIISIDTSKQWDFIHKKGHNEIYYLNCNIMDIYMQFFILNYQKMNYNFRNQSNNNPSKLELCIKNVQIILFCTEYVMDHFFKRTFDHLGNYKGDNPIIDLVFDKIQCINQINDTQVEAIIKNVFYHLLFYTDEIVILCVDHAITQIKKFYTRFINILHLRNLKKLKEPKNKIYIYNLNK